MKLRNTVLGACWIGIAALAGAVQAQTYPSSVLADGPLAYYPLGDPLPVDRALNQGSLGAALDGVHTRVQHRATGALASSGNPATFYDGTALTLIPNRSALNPPANQPFTIEAWLRPTVEENIAVGQAPLSNRKSDGNREGWVFFQRASTNDPGRQQGWNFRMYNGAGGTVSINVTGGTYTTGAWSHVVLVWNGGTATLYVDGASVATSAPGTYLPNVSTPFGIGAYSDPAGSNPFTGDIDEVAFYPVALTANQVLDHYDHRFQSVTDSSYQEMVVADGAVLLQRLDGYDRCRAVAFNSGTTGAQGNGIHFPGATHAVPGALAAGGDVAMRYDGVDKTSNDVTYATALPYDPRLNTESFSWEGWVRPTEEGKGNAQCVFMNYTASGNRVGWVLWQRGSRASASADRGWNFRLYNANSNNMLINIVTGTGTGGYNLNEWQHLAITYHQPSLTAVFYVNGVQVATQTGTGAPYVPNSGQVIPAIGGFANGRENPFYGDIDEVALYDKVLSSSLVAARYAAGTSAAPVTPYADLVVSDGPVASYRLNEVNPAPAANLGTLGAAALGTHVNSPAPIAGPAGPVFKGFGGNSSGSAFRGTASYVELNNPAGLNNAGPITLEAWVQPAAVQANVANNIIAHGANDTFSGEVFLRIENGNYEIGGGTGKASAPVPASDLGTGAWVHLAGTWSAGSWTLYRNGNVLATGTDATGPTSVANANWAIGARGRWKEGAPFTFPTLPAPANHRAFTGGIAHAAIYNKALTRGQVESHFLAGVGPQPLVITRPDGTITLEWSGGILQQSDTLGGWMDVEGAVSPYTPADGPRHFYRLRF